MAKLYVICGHGDGDPGAGGWLNGTYYCEADCVRSLGNRIKTFGGDEVILADTNRNAYYESGLLNWDIPDGIQVVELHMDAADCNARGGHILVKSGIGTDIYDEDLAYFISQFFPGRAQSLREVDWLQNANQAYMRGVSYRLVENGFISDPYDLEKFLNNVDEIAKGYLEIFGILKRNGDEWSSAAQAPETPEVEESESTSSDDDFHGGEYMVMVPALNVRDEPYLSGNVVATYSQGQTVNLDDWYVINDGYVWAKYTAYSGATRYIAVGLHTGSPASDDYLIKV